MKPITKLLAVTIALCLLTSSSKAEVPSKSDTTIYRDEFGIPHIFAPTLEEAAFAVGYAQAEDRLEELLKNYRRAAGTMAELEGQSAFNDDLRQRLMRHAEISEANYGKVSPKMRGVIASYHKGIKQYMTEHPEDVPKWAQEIHGWDVIALGRYIVFNWPIGEAASDLGRAGIQLAPLPYRGSNEMLIAPKRTAMNAPIAVIDPHVPWYDAIRFYEVRIYTPEFNAAGVSILGTPLPTLGHSQFCSVAMTTGGPDTSDIFEEEVNPANPKQYRYDGNWREFTIRNVKLKVKNGDKVVTRELPFAFSHHGPIVAQKDGKAYAMAIPYSEEVGLMDQFYEMMKARNLNEMKKAISLRQLMSQNVMVGTVQGDIFYVRNGRVPIRAKGTNPNLPIPGNTSKTEWLGIHPLEDLVQIENPPGGWMQNCNCSPMAMMNRDQPQPTKYLDRLYVYGDNNSADSHQRAEMMTDLLDKADKVTVEQAIDIAFSTQIWRAERWQERLKKAWLTATEADKTNDTATVYENIQSWNRRTDPDSKGGMAFYAFKKALGGETSRQIEPAANLTDVQLLEALRKAASGLKNQFGEVSVPYGKYFRVGRKGSDHSFPVGGGSQQDLGLATPRAISFNPSRDGKQMIGHTGQSCTQIVVLTNPPESYSVIPLGQSDHKASGHFEDQAEKLFGPGKAYPTFFLRPNELMKHVTSKKVIKP